MLIAFAPIDMFVFPQIDVLGVGSASVTVGSVRQQQPDDTLGEPPADRSVTPAPDNDDSDNNGLVAGISVLAALFILVVLALILSQARRRQGRVDLQDIVARSPNHNNLDDGVVTRSFAHKQSSTRAWPLTLNDRMTSYRTPKRVLSRSLAAEDRQPLWFPNSPDAYSPAQRQLSFVDAPAPLSSPGRTPDGRLPIYRSEAKHGWGVLSSPSIKPQVILTQVAQAAASDEQAGPRPVDMYAL
eukprot:TRINITY_DN12203_c1_g1_i1.p1 TRINITY_DN12203_c1_g1~~TRINITY_DN12203_c1_g1_i1.p1  ORF type:complete len:242 (+),score=38.38 TRINITY_DN12203_c1_g1_i1:57-782(+)